MTGKSLPVAFMVAVALVTWDETAKRGHVPPYPQRYVSVGLVYGLLAILATVAAPAAAVLGWGFILALAYQNAGDTGAASDVADTQTSAPVTAGAAGVVII